jgi:class 3 adenylate cyclase
VTAPEPVTERRLVSVLFADLVGFTTLSESRDAEEVRELLSRYFDTCRRLIELYGGTVEKFIGDAVMAVWGTPTATEDDAERAVRAALDLVAAVSALGDEVGAPELRARAGVLTGEAAVNMAAVGEGMVAGDLVNTASRVQSVAEPGSVFVGESTRRASERAIVYEDAGAHQLKGKEGETQLWRALRVVSGVGGELRSEGLEAPFVGRDRELRQIKDLFHICAEEGRAQLVSVTGIAGIGKSRLAWEFYKYFDGLTQIIYWHRGRCLSYGEGVTYWALADMARMRCRIAEDDDPETALQKLRAALDEHVLDAEERRFVEPRLAQLLGLGEHETRDRQDLFAAWRLFFERLAETYPTVLAFEDMQWADASLLDFVEYLLEWSRDKPLFVVTLARPDLLERRPTWGAGHRNFTSLYLEPLSEQAMEELLTGLVPGLPASLRDQILARAEGVPLYAVETVRMLLDRGLLVEDGSAYKVVGEIGSLEVPETLQALVAARLDGLAPGERRLVQDAAVLGKTFTPASLAALTGQAEAQLEPILTGLARKELLGVQSDPRSPEHGQYGFLQDIIRRVAYETLPKRDRRAKHLAAAEHLVTTLGEEEVAEVVASHLLEAYRLDPDAPEAESLRAHAHTALSTRANAPPRWAPPWRPCVTSNRRPSSRMSRERRPQHSCAPVRWACRPATWSRGRRSLREPSLCTKQWETRTGPAARRPGSRMRSSLAAICRAPSTGWSVRTRSSAGTNPTQISRSCSRASAAHTGLPGISSSPRTAPSGASRSPRHSVCRRCSHADGPRRRGSSHLVSLKRREPCVSLPWTRPARTSCTPRKPSRS